MSIQPNPDVFVANEARKAVPAFTAVATFSSVLGRRNARFERRAIRAL